ncbi:MULTISPECIES: hypothetical protein [Corallococcus]|uniref:hypothetical protein n=1 Tax=Corallococcus TaxID=83461 RepID=UPI00117E1C99|nr:MULTISPECIES: hypothetical protein [Corallococcus]NBD10092.1 hypothetical protein [Corallococcus silvisoli]TSC28423.1 hypothetical protein FOF48_17370 [Corallococcus sp. Z5C101001]
MGSRSFRVVLFAAVTVLALSFGQVLAEFSVGLLDGGLRLAAVHPLSLVELGVVRRLAELGAFTLTGLLLGAGQARVLNHLGLRVPGWVLVTTLGYAVGMLGSRILATGMGWPQMMAPVGMGVVLGAAQWLILRREVHGAVVWVAACTVGFGLAGPAAAWRERALVQAVHSHRGGTVDTVFLMAQGMTVMALALCIAIGGAFIFSSVRSQVLPGPGSRMPGALAQFALLGLAVPLMICVEARMHSVPRTNVFRCDPFSSRSRSMGLQARVSPSDNDCPPVP